MPSNPVAQRTLKTGGLLKATAYSLVLIVGTFALARSILITRKIDAAKKADEVQNLLVPRLRIGVLRGVALNGAAREVASPSDGKSRLLIITFSPDCPTCATLFGRWQTLATSLRSKDSWSVLWVSKASVAATKQVVAERNIPPEEVLADPDYRTYETLKMQSVPQMAVVEGRGMISRVFWGNQPWAEKDVAQLGNAR
jgi:hypothetical protein